MSAGQAAIIDGKAVAGLLREGVAARVAKVIRAHGFTPHLAVVMVGDNPASEVYVRNKTKQADGIFARTVVNDGQSGQRV